MKKYLKFFTPENLGYILITPSIIVVIAYVLTTIGAILNIRFLSFRYLYAPAFGTWGGGICQADCENGSFEHLELLTGI